MGSLSPELQEVLREAARAQELEDGQDWPAAIDVYHRTGCQLSYMLDMHVDKHNDGTLAELLCGLHSQYQQRITVSTCCVTNELRAVQPPVLQELFCSNKFNSTCWKPDCPCFYSSVQATCLE